MTEKKDYTFVEKKDAKFKLEYRCDNHTELRTEFFATKPDADARAKFLWEYQDNGGKNADKFKVRPSISDMNGGESTEVDGPKAAIAQTPTSAPQAPPAGTPPKTLQGGDTIPTAGTHPQTPDDAPPSQEAVPGPVPPPTPPVQPIG